MNGRFSAFLLQCDRRAQRHLASDAVRMLADRRIAASVAMATGRIRRCDEGEWVPALIGSRLCDTKRLGRRAARWMASAKKSH